MTAALKTFLLGSAFAIVALAAPGGAWAQTSTVTGPATIGPCLPEGKDLPLVTAGTLTMSINATIPPSQFIDRSGKIVGLNVDFGNEIARRLCLAPYYANVQFEVQIPGLQSKRWDMIDTGLYFTPERAKIMQLIPYSVNSLALIVPAGNPKAIKAPKDLAGKVVGVEIAGFEEKTLRAINDEQVKAGSAPMDIRVFNTYGDTFQAMRAGQLDAVFAGDLIGAYYEKQGQFTTAVTGLFPGSPAAFATAEPKLAAAVVAALSAMVADGTYDKLMSYYGSAKIDKWKDYPGKIQYFYMP
jgi:polar amino acid transport system substrate-binding protein